MYAHWHIVMTNGPAKKPCAPLSPFTDTTMSQLMERVIENCIFSHAAFEANISGLDILISYQLGETLKKWRKARGTACGQI